MRLGSSGLMGEVKKWRKAGWKFQGPAEATYSGAIQHISAYVALAPRRKSEILPRSFAMGSRL